VLGRYQQDRGGCYVARMHDARISTLIVLLVLASFTAAAGAPSPIPAGSDYGAGLTLSETTPLADIVRAPETFAARPVLVRGRISDVCQRKGCWVVLRDGGDQVRVRFHDYGFFLPTDVAGSEAFVQGLVKLEEREVGFTATGVRIVPGP